MMIARFFLLILLGLLIQRAPVSAEAELDGVVCDATVVDVATVEVASAHAVPDIYLSAVKDIAVEPGSIFKVYRKKEVITGQERSSVRIFIGRLSVLSAQDGMHIGRLIEFAAREEYPHVRYETVMVGDCLILDSVPARPAETAETAPASPVQPEMPPLEVTSGTGATLQRRRIIPPKILFAFDSAQIEPQWHEQLEGLAQLIKRHHLTKVYLEGHADSVGPEAYNLQLSRRRAQAAVDHLVNVCGVDGGIFEIVPFGEGRPETSNDSEEGRRRNRRVFISVLFDALPASGENGEETEGWPIAVTSEALAPEEIDLPIIR